MTTPLSLTFIEGIYNIYIQRRCGEKWRSWNIKQLQTELALGRNWKSVYALTIGDFLIETNRLEGFLNVLREENSGL